MASTARSFDPQLRNNQNLMIWSDTEDQSDNSQHLPRISGECEKHMAILKLRAVQAINPELDFRLGIRQMPSFKKTASTGASAAFPYPSVRSMVLAAQWPKAIRYTGKNPDEIQPPGDWTEAVNAVLLDRDFWYFVQERAFTQLPISVKLDDDATGKRWFVWPHGGGSSLFRGLLYVAIHGNESIPLPDGEVWVVEPKGPDAAPEILARQVVSGSESLPWIDVHPRRPLLYWSHFDAGTREQLQICSFSPWPDFAIKPLGALTLVTELGDEIDLRRVQGGRVTPNNHILLICDTPPKDAVAGIHLFDLQTGRRRWHVRFEDIDYWSPPFSLIREQQDEVQGIVISDFGPNGFLHINMVNKDLDARTDDFSFLNYDVVPVFDRWKL